MNNTTTTDTAYNKEVALYHFDVSATACIGVTTLKGDSVFLDMMDEGALLRAAKSIEKFASATTVLVENGDVYDVVAKKGLERVLITHTALLKSCPSTSKAFQLAHNGTAALEAVQDLINTADLPVRPEGSMKMGPPVA